MKRFPALCLFLSLLLTPAAFAGASVASYVELSDAPTIAVDWSKGDALTVTLHGNRALAFSNGQRGGKYMLIIKQDQTGSRTVTWPSSVRLPGGGSPQKIVLTMTADKTDYISFFFNGDTYDMLSMSQAY
jgi:hypothetical protein